MHPLAVALLVIAVCIPFALAAIPPLPKAELQRQSTLIVVGTVTSVSSTIQQKEAGYSDRIYRIELRVESIEKGDAAHAGQSILATTWQPAIRPDGWVGPQGQNTIPPKGATVRCYLVGERDQYTVLVPNGIEVIEH